LRLGESLRRTRQKAKRVSVWRRKGPDGRTYVTFGDGLDWRVLGLQVVGLAVVGWVVGYLVATRLAFPAPPPPENLVEVPDVRWLGVPGAGDRLLASGLALGRVDSLHHPGVRRDLVLGQSPLPGQLALPGTEVWVTRSRGAQLRAVPDVMGVEGSRARIVLETSGFVVTSDTVPSEEPRGRVVSMTPPADSTVSLPAEIRVLLSQGPPLVPMPALLGLEQERAVALLDSLGLVAGEIDEVFRFGRDQGIVVEQNPTAGTELERGSTIRLAVGRRGG
jgi:beta-lactam-binding protein with PASTA domain